MNYNLPLLKDAFQRGDDVRLASDPSTFSFGAFGDELDAIEGPPHNFKEIYNYIYNSTTSSYEKQ